jgi:pyridoxine 5-phosphate synthase
MSRLGVNIDHIATLRQARGGCEPDPVWAAVLAELGGADGITVHLREDRRHIQDRDLRLLRQTVQVRLNLELAVDPDVVAIALELRPDQVTFVPERRQELTTEGGLDVDGQRDRVGEAVKRCRESGIETALFINPDPRQVEAALALGVAALELHTGRYADAPEGAARDQELVALEAASAAVVAAGLELHAGHGLNYRNVAAVSRIGGMAELNIGHSIVSRAVFVGLTTAVREMKECIIRAKLGACGATQGFPDGASPR